MILFLGAATKGGPKTPVKPSAQKGSVKTAPPKQAAAAAVKTPQGKKKKGHKHQQYELIVTINLVSVKLCITLVVPHRTFLKALLIPWNYYFKYKAVAGSFCT